MKKITYYSLEFNEPVDGYYRYLMNSPETTDGYLYTDVPADAMKWFTEKDAAKYLESFPYRKDFHVQAMLTEDDNIEFVDEYGRPLP